MIWSLGNLTCVDNWTLRFFTAKMASNPVVAREIPERNKNS